MPSTATGLWRAMTAADLDAVVALSDAIHGPFSEQRETYAERLALYPDGCRIFERDGVVAGYLITHPWHRTPPKLDALLGALPADAETYYLHDIALLPAARGCGAGRHATDLVRAMARRAGCADITLTAVNGADRFWAAQGFDYDAQGGHPYGADTYLMRCAA